MSTITTDRIAELEALAAKADVRKSTEISAGDPSHGPDYDRVGTTYDVPHVGARLTLQIDAWADGDTDTTARLFAGHRHARVRASLHGPSGERWVSVAAETTDTAEDGTLHARQVVAHLTVEDAREMHAELGRVLAEHDA